MRVIYDKLIVYKRYKMFIITVFKAKEANNVDICNKK